MTYRSKNPLGLGQPGYAAERYVPTNLGQANYAAERYVPVSLGQPGYAAERYVPVSLGQPGYAAERYIPTNLGRAPYAMERYIPASLGQPGYAAERYIPMSGLGQTKTGTTATSGSKTGTSTTTSGGKTGGSSGGGMDEGTARDIRTAADVGGSLIGGVIRGFTGGSTTTPATTPDTTSLTTTTEPASSGGSDWYWPVVISGGLILVGGIGYFALKGKKSAPTPNKRKRVSRNTGTRGWHTSGGLFRKGDWAWDSAGAFGRGDLLHWNESKRAFSLVAKDVTLDEANAKIASRSKRVSRNGYGRSRYGSSYSGDPRWMTARYDGTDDQGNRVRKGDEVLYWPSTKKMMTGQRAKDAWLRFLSEKGDEEGMPFARNGRKRVSRNRKPAAADPIGARELLLVTENEYSLYRLHQDIEKNLLRKLKSGKYDHAKAAKAWQYWMDAGAKLYVKQYGGSFSPATRALAASEYADQWYESYKAGDVKANRRKRSSRR